MNAAAGRSGLISPTLYCALEFLEEGLWVIPRAVPKGGRILAQYELSKRAECFLNDVVDPMRDAVRKNVAALGYSELKDVQALYR